MLKHKRTLAGILAATMMLSMAACGGGGSQKDGDVAEGPQDPNAAAAAGTLELTDWEQSSTRPTKSCTRRQRRRAR